MSSSQPEQRSRNRSRRIVGSAVATLSILALGLGIGPAPVAAQDAPAAPTVTGESCAPDTGVTVVVDYQSLGEVTLGCALGEQSDGFAALTNAGFTFNETPGAPGGAICQITALPAAGYPACFNVGFWSYLKSDGATAWASSNVGASNGPLPVGSVEGWAWTSPVPADFAGALPRVAVDELAGYAGTTDPVDPPDPVDPTTDACSTPLSADGGPDAALDWLACELEANGGSMPGFSPGTSDYGLTIDAILAFTTNGRADDPAAVTATSIVKAGVKSYVTDIDFGDGSERYVGALAKSLLMAELRGENVDDFGGMDLDDELLARLQTSGVDAGRFSDFSQYGDYSNGFGQTLAILGLSYTDAGIPASAVDFLLDQQCPAGGFRGTYDTPGGCASDAVADTDYTGLAIQALLSSPASAEVDTAISEAVAWLLARQDGSGAFGGNGVTSGVNTNSAGFAAQALRATGQGTAADAAAAWIQSLQLTTANTDDGGNAARSVRAPGPAAADVGAIAYDPAGFESALANGVGTQGRDQWRRASAQAALAFKAGSFGAPRAVVPPVDPPVTTVPVDPTTTPTTPTVPTTVSTTPAPGVSAGNGTASGVPASSATSLPRTGASIWSMTAAGLLTLLAGGVVVALSRRRVARS